MKKKKSNILVAVFVSLAVVAISVMGIVSELFNPYISYKVNELGGQYFSNEDLCELIQTKNELDAYFDYDYQLKHKKLFVDKYTDSYFKENSIIFLAIYVPDTAHEYSIKDICRRDRVLIVDINHKLFEAGFTIQYFWLVLIEVKKSDIKGITEIQTKVKGDTYGI